MNRRILIVIIVMVMGSLWAESPLDRVYRLYDEGKYEAGLIVVDSLISAEGENRSNLQAKYYLLDGLGQLQKALDAALAAEKANEKQSPWDCILVTEAYIKLNRKEDALNWLGKAVDRGFISFKTLADSVYDPLRETETYQTLVETIQENIGMGKPAKAIALNLLDGQHWTLSEQKGKVVLIDFFATWCPPCREEIPNLKKIYSTHSRDTFELISISLDSDIQTLETFIQKEGLNWHFSFSGQGWNDSNAKQYGVNSIPSIWLVDKQGILRNFDVRGEALADAVKGLLAE